jgi:hypothetical protein
VLCSSEFLYVAFKIFLEFGERGGEVRENKTVKKVYLLSSTNMKQQLIVFSVLETGF